METPLVDHILFLFDQIIHQCADQPIHLHHLLLEDLVSEVLVQAVPQVLELVRADPEVRDYIRDV